MGENGLSIKRKRLTSRRGLFEGNRAWLGPWCGFCWDQQWGLSCSCWSMTGGFLAANSSKDDGITSVSSLVGHASMTFGST